MAVNPPGLEQGPSGVHTFLSLRVLHACVTHGFARWCSQQDAGRVSHSGPRTLPTPRAWRAELEGTGSFPLQPQHKPDWGSRTATPNASMLQGGRLTHQGQKRDPPCSALDKPVQLCPSHRAPLWLPWLQEEIPAQPKGQCLQICLDLGLQ